MAELREFPEIENKKDEYLDLAFRNILMESDINKVKSIRDEIYKIILDIPDTSNLPAWFNGSLRYAIDILLSIFTNPEDSSRESRPTEAYKHLMFNEKSDTFNKDLTYTIPFLQNYALILKLNEISNKQLENYNNIDLQIQSSIEETKKPVSTLISELEIAKTQVNEALARINKEVGKIGVKKYAEIFEDQAKSHSTFSRRVKREDDTAVKGWDLGDSQRWIATAVCLILATIYLASNLNCYFPVDGNTYTPQVLVNITGRAVAISVAIFLISFAFKQYRISMHLHTMNIFRANTLKSFEYLTKAPDSLSPESYNAILMKVAESIYEAGQTGYIDSSEKHNDIPSIVDMTKIVNPIGKNAI